MHFKDPVDSLQSVSVLWNGFELNITLLSIYPSIHSSIYPSTYPTNMTGTALGARESWKNADYCGVDKLTNCPIEWSDKSSGGVCPRGSELSVKNLALWPIGRFISDDKVGFSKNESWRKWDKGNIIKKILYLERYIINNVMTVFCVNIFLIFGLLSQVLCISQCIWGLRTVVSSNTSNYYCQKWNHWIKKDIFKF